MFTYQNWQREKTYCADAVAEVTDVVLEMEKMIAQLNSFQGKWILHDSVWGKCQ